MAKLGLFTIISVLINLFLTFWLINQYMSDVYFQVYVNGAIGQYYPFIVLTLGIGGGSGVGYLFLKRKHGDGSLVGKIQKSKNFKPAGPFTTTTVSAPKSVLPSGAPPAPVSKHTAYAVPPLPKASTPSSSRGTTPTTWAASSPSKSALDSILAPKQETTPKPSISEIPRRNIEPSKPVSTPFQSQTVTQPPQPLRSIGELGTKQAPSWTQQPSQFGERGRSQDQYSRSLAWISVPSKILRSRDSPINHRLLNRPPFLQSGLLRKTSLEPVSGLKEE
ncbi:MAG TPA: hypothetical protein VE955_00035 [Candidatus Dormibacteraeota bacterium]|nr:hypothetical protein [Candidatus Dormibacteraeota bacterium]